LEPITTESLTLVTLLLYAIERVKTQDIFKLLKDRVYYQENVATFANVQLPKGNFRDLHL